MAQPRSRRRDLSRRGLFVTFEGIDGSGKSTQARRLAEDLRAKGREVVLTREPGGSPGAEEIRSLVLEGDPDRWSAETEILLFTAARRDHMERTIWPALKAGKVVICDRFADSTRMYQGLSRGQLRPIVDRLHDLMIADDPDLTLLIDMDPALGLSRAKGRQGHEERFEDFGLDLQARMREGFLDLAAEFPARFRVIDGNRAADEVAADIRHLIAPELASDLT
ncbi:MAG: dTMP kinase [Rhodobacteraceae bacterium]|nr:dTMP kinase [Paracoccaceae bacterium]MAY44782.1 dTMP kinase [Paracoccaceae bacterium]QEW19434.1 Thymidylate kinase [Marinibacterium anthonyi]